MPDQHRVPEATELIYVPKPSWAPLFVAAGLAGILVGLVDGLVYLVVGVLALIVALAKWVRDSGLEISRMPRHQRVTSSVLPPLALRPPPASSERRD